MLDERGNYTRIVQPSIEIPREYDQVLSFSSLSSGGSKDPSSPSARFVLNLRRTRALLVNLTPRRPDGSKDQSSKGKAPRERAEQRREKREREATGNDGWIAESRVGYLDCPRSGHFPRYALDARRETRRRMLASMRILLSFPDELAAAGRPKIKNCESASDNTRLVNLNQNKFATKRTFIVTLARRKSISW